MRTIVSFLMAVLPLSIFAQTPMSIETLSNLTYARAAHQQIVISPDKFLVIGGHVNGFNLTKNAELYNASTKLWETVVANDNRDMGFIAKLHSGKYLIGGGCSRALGVGQLATSEIYDPTTNSFTPAASMAVARTNANAATLSDGRVLVVGNWYNSAGIAEVYNPTTNSFTSTGACLVERAYPVIIPTNDGGAIVCGGTGTRGGEPARYIFEKYNPTTNAFTELSNTLFGDETSWNIASYVPTLTQQFKLPNGKYAVLVYDKAITKARLISIDPETNEIAEIVTQKPISLTDDQNPGVTFGCARTPLINQAQNLLHILQQGGSTSNIILRMVTINLATGSVNTAQMDGFNFSVASSNVSMLDNGNILFTAGNKFDNFTLANNAFILTPATYVETSTTNINKNEITARWNKQANAFTLSVQAKEIRLYDINGQLIAQTSNSNTISSTAQAPGVYLLKVTPINTSKTELIKAIKYE